MAGSYTNPIIPGFAPDPTVICVDGTFFLVNSSFHMFPGLPVYASKNLRSWTQIGNAINRRSQLCLANARTLKQTTGPGGIAVVTFGLFAPTIRYHKGIFYLTCTNVSFPTGSGPSLQNFYVTTKDIWANDWSDPIPYQWPGIDPSLFFDDDDCSYIHGQWWLGDPNGTQPTGTIKLAEIDIMTGELLTGPKEIWAGFSKISTEGPHLYKKDGYYYVLAAEGGTFENHMISMARSKNIWGSYESYEQNPVLTASGKDEYVQNVGHGDIFQDSQGLWWAVVLAVRHGPGGRYPLSRETFLTPVHWPTGSWPTFSQPRIGMARPESQILALPALTHAQATGLDLLYIRDPAIENYTISPDHQKITVRASQTDLSAPIGTTSFIGKRQRALDSVASCRITHSLGPLGKNIKAGIAVFKDQFRFGDIVYSYATNEVVFSWLKQATGEAMVTKKAAKLSAAIAFKIQASEMQYEFLYKQEGEDWVRAGTMDSMEMTARDFTSPIFGIFASGEEMVEVVFEDVELGSWRDFA